MTERVKAIVSLIKTLEPDEQQRVLLAIVSLLLPDKAVPDRARGGRARAAAMTPEERSEQARNAAAERWRGRDPN